MKVLFDRFKIICLINALLVTNVIIQNLLTIMKRRLSMMLKGTFMIVLLALSYPTQANTIFKDDYRYVLAPHGLNMRQEAKTFSKKLLRLPYGAKVKYIGSVASRMIMVDHLRAGMAKISYQGKVGYAFAGYLSKFVAPPKNIEMQKYADLLRKNGIEVMNEEVKKDWGGYQQIENAVTLNTQSWEKAFIIAKQLFAIPAKLKFPQKSMQAKTVIKNPNKKKHVWTDEMIIKRTEAGSLLSIAYNSRQEGGGRYVTIKRSTTPDAKGMRLSVVYIVD